MPSTSKRQHNLMAMVAHDPAAAKRVGIPQSVGEEFVKADKGRKFGSGGTESRADLQTINNPKVHRGKMKLFAKGGEMRESKAMAKKEISFMERKGAPKSMIKHEKEEYGMKKGGNVTGKGPSKERKGLTMEKMGKVTAGGIKKFGEHTVQQKGHTRGKNLGDAGKTVGIMRGGSRGR